jgi:putative photosynthetic complex assembly protein
MSDPFRNQTFPKPALLGAAALIVFTLAAAAAGRAGYLGGANGPGATAVAQRMLRFDDRPDGAVEVVDTVTDRRVAMLAQGSNVFIRGTLRGFARARRAEDIGRGPAFALTHWADGRLTIADPLTGRTVDLGAFGITNATAFAVLLSAPEQVR